MSEQVDVQEFQSRLNQRFDLHLGEGRVVSLELIQVDDRGPRQVREGRRQSYSLLFRSPGERGFAPQATYRLEHATLGAIEVFLVPVGPDPGGMLYEAVFS